MIWIFKQIIGFLYDFQALNSLVRGHRSQWRRIVLDLLRKNTTRLTLLQCFKQGASSRQKQKDTVLKNQTLVIAKKRPTQDRPIRPLGQARGELTFDWYTLFISTAIRLSVLSCRLDFHEKIWLSKIATIEAKSDPKNIFGELESWESSCYDANDSHASFNKLKAFMPWFKIGIRMHKQRGQNITWVFG